jgi:hypothetical protein
MFLRACLGQLQRATSEGVPVDGYFLCVQDNFEWMDGYEQPLRSDLRRLRHARADAEAQRRMVPPGGEAERRGLGNTRVRSRCWRFVRYLA